MLAPALCMAHTLRDSTGPGSLASSFMLCSAPALAATMKTDYGNREHNCFEKQPLLWKFHDVKLERKHLNKL